MIDSPVCDWLTWLRGGNVTPSDYERARSFERILRNLTELLARCKLSLIAPPLKIAPNKSPIHNNFSHRVWKQSLFKKNSMLMMCYDDMHPEYEQMSLKLGDSDMLALQTRLRSEDCPIINADACFSCRCISCRQACIG